MKQFFRVVVLLLLVGGWALASAAVHVVRVPGEKLPVIMTKNQLTYTDTYVDTRQWTLADDRNHPEFVRRVIESGKTNVLAHTVNTTGAPVADQLMAAVGTPNRSIVAVK